ncbi:MAG TPA: hypothetical protein VFP32_02910, partial [Candidatus Saccharimonadales bacterium]|nr:hypothetical protein [Candidatus Saccharimonadales bacterium]
MKPLQDGLSVIEALFILIVICLIGFIAWHEWEIHHKKLITTQSSFVNLPRGNLNDTYIYDKKVFPNLANDYSLIYRSDASPRAVEVDYISNKTLSTIHSDMVSICKERGFKFQPPASDLSIE